MKKIEAKRASLINLIKAKAKAKAITQCHIGKIMGLYRMKKKVMITIILLLLASL